MGLKVQISLWELGFFCGDIFFQTGYVPFTLSCIFVSIGSLSFIVNGGYGGNCMFSGLKVLLQESGTNVWVNPLFLNPINIHL